LCPHASRFNLSGNPRVSASFPFVSIGAQNLFCRRRGGPLFSPSVQVQRYWSHHTGHRWIVLLSF
jgi:hypothetical protein